MQSMDALMHASIKNDPKPSKLVFNEQRLSA